MTVVFRLFSLVFLTFAAISLPGCNTGDDSVDPEDIAAEEKAAEDDEAAKQAAEAKRKQSLARARGKRGRFAEVPAEPVGQQTLQSYNKETKKLEATMAGIRYSDDSFVKHGDYTEYHQNGGKFAEGQYDEDARVGEWRFYHPNGTLARTVVYKQNRPDGKWTHFGEDGAKLAEVSYREGKRDGAWIRYDDKGERVASEQEYVDGKLHGVSTSYFANGNKNSQTEFKEGRLHGVSRRWYESGEKQVEAYFVNSLLHGKSTEWNEKGEVVREVTYRKGKPAPRPSETAGQ